jgi:hypothetical protein
MSKVAKLVYVSLVTRVVVDENASEDEILNTARSKFIEKVTNELGENLEEIVDDTECPYDPVVELTAEEIEVLSKNKFAH